jgi:cation:H+ antiporter
MVVWLQLLAGLGLLIVGAQLLVQGAASLALRLRVSPLVVGLTVVAFGTSSPELAVSVRSALAGQADLALGNVVGSNIFNVLLILGVSSLITPLAVHRQLVRFDVPLMMGASVLLLLFALDGRLTRGEGVLLLGCGLAYTGYLYWQGRNEGTQAGADELAQTTRSIGVAIGLVVVGLALLVFGARWLVDSASVIARGFGVSELVIGLTVVAAGTSLPEVATSVVASLRGERDIAVGNVVGSNLFNILWVLGAAGSVSVGGLEVSPAVLRFDLPVAVAVAFACLPIFFSGYRIERWEGGLFLAFYLGYLVVVLRGAPPDFPHWALLGFVAPLTALTVAVLWWQRRRIEPTG